MESKQHPVPDPQGNLALSGFVASALVAALLVGGTYWMSARQADTQGSINHTQEVLAALAATRADALEPPGQALAGNLRRLRALTQDNPLQQSALDAVEQRLLAGAQGGTEAAGLRATLQQMEAEERRLLAQRLEQRRRGLDAFWAGMAAVFVALLAALVFLHQQIRRKRSAERRLLEGEQQFHAMTDSVTDYAILMLDAQGRVRSWNPGAARIKGYEASEIVGRPFACFYPPEDVANDLPRRALAAAERDGHYVGEGWRVRKDGSRFWASVTLSPVRGRDGALTGFCKITRDLTARRRDEQDLLHLNTRLEALVAERTGELQQSNRALGGAKERLQALSSRLISAQEEERRHIARELHDETGQALTLIRMQLAGLLATSPTAQEPLRECMAGVDGAIRHIRGLALRLRPPMLDDLGLADALEWVVETQARAAGWRQHLELPELEERLPGEVETACFRICQEALTNAARYAGASEIRVTLRVTPADLQLEVADNGAGFDLARYQTLDERKQHFGLVSMSERAVLAGGSLRIDTAPGRGTCVRAVFRLGPEDDDAPASEAGELVAWARDDHAGTKPARA